MGLQTYTRSMLSVDPKQQRAETDTHALSHTFILFSGAKAEVHHVALMFGVKGFPFTPSLDFSQQNQVWPLTSVSDPQKE